MFDLNDSPLQSANWHYDLDELNRLLAETAHDWVPRLFPAGKQLGNELRLANIHGAPPNKQGSCVIQLFGPNAGCWYDHDNAVKRGGGPLDTFKHALGVHLESRELIKAAAEYVGLAPTSGTVIAPPEQRTGGSGLSRPAIRSAEKPSKRARDQAEIQRLYDESVPIAGTLAETYLVDSRGLRPPQTDELRFHPSVSYWSKEEGGWALPAMLGVVRDAAGAVVALHRTYLKPDGSGKAEIQKPKKFLGSTKGGTIKISPMTADGELGIAEGIETAIAASMLSGLPIWSGLSDSGMADCPFPEGLRHLHIFADAGRAGEAAAQKLRARCRAAGIRFTIHRPLYGDDFADDLEKGRAPFDPATVCQPDIQSLTEAPQDIVTRIPLALAQEQTRQLIAEFISQALAKPSSETPR
jgi:putative DNA primase/helicase